MANRPVNDAQRKVLDWLATGATQDPPTPEMKLSAAALKGRGLVKVRRPGGVWTAELTDAGRYYVEHGDYPPQAGPVAPAAVSETPAASAQPKAPRAKSTPESAAATPEAGYTGTPPVEAPSEPDVPLRQVVRRPHPAVKEIRDRPGRLPKFAKRRCVLIAHSLVQQALARGWAVTPVIGRVEHDRWSGRNVHYDKQSLLIIDAGHAPVGIVFDEVTKRQPHVDTPEEAAKRAKGEYVYAPRYDYNGTGKLRLHLTAHDRKSQNFTDGAKLLTEDDLARVIDAIEAATTQALHWAEQRRLREEEEDRRRKEAQRIQGLRQTYEEWEARLNARADQWARHRELVEYVNAVEESGDESAQDFIAWSRGFLAATDPRHAFKEWDIPEWTHEQRAEAGRPEPKPQYSWQR